MIFNNKEKKEGVKEDLRGEISGEGFEKFKTKQKMDIGFLFYFYFREKCVTEGN